MWRKAPSQMFGGVLNAPLNAIESNLIKRLQQRLF